MSSLGCAQRVLLAFRAEMGMDEKSAIALGYPFNGGHHAGFVCGVVSGVHLVLGALYGPGHGDDKESALLTKSLMEKWNSIFFKEYGSFHCDMLLAKAPGRKRQEKIENLCGTMTQRGIEILRAIIAEEKQSHLCYNEIRVNQMIASQDEESPCIKEQNAG